MSSKIVCEIIYKKSKLLIRNAEQLCDLRCDGRFIEIELVFDICFHTSD